MKSGQPALDRHRGPFALIGWRATPKAKHPFKRIDLAEALAREDVDEHAQMFLEDPRDTIDHISVWSVTEQQHVYTYRKEDL